MNPSEFQAPSLEVLNGLLPAFEFTALIASNPHGAVYMARQRSLERDVAIKLLSPQVSGNAAFRQSFETTARTMARLNHPNLIGVYDSGFVDGMLYFVMEFVPGKSLEHSSRGQKVEFSQALRLIEEVSDGLSHAHSHGIVHGDLNPSDILLNQKAEPKIGNFGFTHPMDGSGEGVAPSPFTAPEVIGNPERLDQKSDIFAVGALLYQLITGSPHNPDGPPPSELSDCGTPLDEVWRKSTDPDPAKRFADMASFRKAVTELAKSRRSAAIKTPPASQRLAGSANSPRPGNPAAPPVPPGEGAATAVRPHRGHNVKLVRNLIIIAGLIYAITLAWKNLEAKRVERDKENARIRAEEAAEREQAIAEAKRIAEERAKSRTQPDTGSLPDNPEPEPIKESPKESLARLRDALAAGERGEMPVGSQHQGEYDYFLVEEPMSWPEAAWFAEQHGAHLAIPNATADLTWLVRTMAKGQGIWIGAAHNGRRTWALADGLMWTPKKEPSGLGTYLSVDKFGLLRAEGLGERLPFVIQWHGDGSNPGSLQAVLAKSRGTLSQSSPVYPPGTMVIDNRHYLYVARPVNWNDAEEIAEKSGGHLVVASDIGEITHLGSMTDEITADEGVWLGGFRKGDQWVWITGEPWKNAKWASNTPMDSPNAALVALPKKGWESKDSSENASGFVIEWSNDHKSSTPVSPDKNTASKQTGELATLISKAKDLIAAADLKRTEQLATNSRKLPWDLDIYLRNLPKGEQLVWSPHVTRLKNCVLNNRVPASIPESSGIKLSAAMAKAASSCAEKQERIDADFAAEAETIRTAFVGRVRESMNKAQQSGQRALVQAHQEALDAASDLAKWVRSLGVELKPENPTPVGSKKSGDNDDNNRSPNRIPGGGGKSIFE